MTGSGRPELIATQWQAAGRRPVAAIGCKPDTRRSAWWGGYSVKCRSPIVIHYVHDMERAKAFYISVFEVKALFDSPGWTTLDFGGVELALHILYPGSRDPEAPLPHAGLNLEVDDIEAMKARVEQHGGRMTELREPESGVPVRLGTFKDCEGNGFELRQQP